MTPIENVVRYDQWVEAYSKFAVNAPHTIKHHKARFGRASQVVRGEHVVYVWDAARYSLEVSKRGVTMLVPVDISPEAAWNLWHEYVDVLTKAQS